MTTAQAATNEDWIKTIAWDVRGPDGQPVTTLADLAEVLGVDEDEAAQQLLDSPAVQSAPEALRTEAQDRVGAGQDEDVATLFDAPEAQAPAPTGDAAAAATPAEGAVPPEVEGKAGKPPWLKGGKDEGSADTGSSTRKVTIAAGAYVSWSGGKGKVEMVVTNGGKVPGVDTDMTGTKDAPACRVRKYEESDGKWKATDTRVAVKASSLKTIPPLGKDSKSGAAGLVLLMSEYAESLEGKANPGANAVRTVYGRGLRAYPGQTKTLLGAEDWALGRARAFLEKCAGIDTPGYIGDDDLLPALD